MRSSLHAWLFWGIGANGLPKVLMAPVIPSQVDQGSLQTSRQCHESPLHDRLPETARSHREPSGYALLVEDEILAAPDACEYLRGLRPATDAEVAMSSSNAVSII
jgi:hypothetical protein